MFGLGGRPLDFAKWTKLIISNEEMNDFMKIVKSLEESAYWQKTLAKQLKMKQKNKKEYFLVCY